MQQAADRQKALAVHAAMLSDPRLPMQVTDYRSIRWLEGRVITHGEEENSGRAYMLLEGTDARVHFIYHSREIASAWQRGRLRPNSFVRLRRLSDDQALSVSDLGDADRMLSNKDHFLRGATQLRKNGTAAASVISAGWLGQYYRELDEAVAVIEARLPKTARSNPRPAGVGKSNHQKHSDRAR